MLRLPKTISADIRVALQGALSSSSLDQALQGLTDGSRGLFGASEAFCALHTEALPDVIRCFSAERPGFSNDFAELLWSNWKSAGIHERLTRDLLLRLSSISYSAFSWPYARIQAERDLLLGEKYAIPRDYSIVLPFCSELIVHDTDDPAYFGYVVLFFNSFPQISDETVQLLITLPGIISEISAAYLRR